MSNKKHDMAVALLMFSKAWNELATASKALPDEDVSSMYPFYMLDYERIAPDVQAWCQLHASRLFHEASEMMPNPRCVGCPFLMRGLDDSGLCSGMSTIQCWRYPYAAHDVTEMALALNGWGVSVEGLSALDIELRYKLEVSKHYADTPS